MGELKKQRRLPWGMLVCLALLTGLTVGMYQYWLTPPASRSSTLAMVLAASLMFLIGRGLLNYTWGLTMAVLLVIHPTTLQYVQLPGDLFITPEIWALAALVCLLALWRQVFAPQLSAWQSLGIFLVLAVVGGLAWLAAPRAGVTVALLTMLGLLLAGFLAGQRRRRVNPADRPHLVNVLTGYVLGIFAPVAGLLLVPVLKELLVGLGTLMPEFVAWSGLDALLRVFAEHPPSPFDLFAPLQGIPWPELTWPPVGFRALEQTFWIWPTPWLVLPLTVYGLWRTFYAGCRHTPTRHPPLSWLLLLYAVLVVAGVMASRDLRIAYPLVVLVVLLSVFAIGDWFRELGQSMILAPPGERDEAM